MAKKVKKTDMKDLRAFLHPNNRESANYGSSTRPQELPKKEDEIGYLYINLFVALLVRIGFIVYGTWQDAHMKVKFTDIDYKVFTDAAEHVTQGESPFKRATYRYTPLIAWLLTPNITVHILFGKVLFVLLDLVAGYLLYRICRSVGYSQNTSLFCCQMALFNPLPLGVSSRGNAESIMTVLTLATIYYLTQKNRKSSLCIAAVLYGLSVHVKIYPVIYALPIYLYLGETYTGSHSKLRIAGIDIFPNSSRLSFIFISLSVCLGLTAICYYFYGFQFLYETYLYHIVRKDIKHNFSPYFYLLYLIEDTDLIAPYIGLITFIPQALFVVGFAYKFHSDLPFCFFIQTFMFVSFNKVCTSQYFLWYLAYLPILLPRLSLTAKKIFLIVFLWFFGQAAWLLPAYYLEFQGKNTFFEIWLASMGFLTINVWIAWELLTHYNFPQAASVMHGRGAAQTTVTGIRELNSVGVWLGLGAKKKRF